MLWFPPQFASMVLISYCRVFQTKTKNGRWCVQMGGTTMLGSWHVSRSDIPGQKMKHEWNIGLTEVFSCLFRLSDRTNLQERRGVIVLFFVQIWLCWFWDSNSRLRSCRWLHDPQIQLLEHTRLWASPQFSLKQVCFTFYTTVTLRLYSFCWWS